MERLAGAVQPAGAVIDGPLVATSRPYGEPRPAVRVSVIIATYNYGHLLEESVRSAQAQTVRDVEIIVVDDGSTDDTAEVLGRIDDPRVSVHRIPHSGVAVARNTALRMARGEFVAFLDADDRWLPTKLERQLAMMESEPELGLVFSDLVRFSDRGFAASSQFAFSPGVNTVPSRPSRCGQGRVITGDTFTSVVRHRLPLWPVTVMIRMAAVRDIRFPSGVPICEDLHYMLLVAPRVQAGFIVDPLVEVRRHTNNSYSTPRHLMEAGLSVFRKLEAEPLPAEHLAELRKRIGESLIELSYHCFHTRDLRCSALAALEALRYPGSRLQALKRLAQLPGMPLLAAPGRVDWRRAVA